MIKVKTLVFCENVMSTEMFTKCLRPIIQQCLSCQHGATASWILPVLAPSKVATGTIFNAFGMARPGFEPRTS